MKAMSAKKPGEDKKKEEAQQQGPMVHMGIIVPLGPKEKLIGYVVVAFVEREGVGNMRTRIEGLNPLMVPSMLKKAYRTLDKDITAPG